MDNENERYNVVRYFRDRTKRKIILKNVSLAVAKLHCNDPKTQKENEWFDGFEKRNGGMENH